MIKTWIERTPAGPYLGGIDALQDVMQSEIDALRAELAKHCNCEFEGEVNTKQCTLHNAWAETLNEQATYRRERDEYQQAADDMAADHKVERDGFNRLDEQRLESLHAIESERDALRADAERYWWLMDACTCDDFEELLPSYGKLNSEADIYSAIDAEIANAAS